MRLSQKIPALFAVLLWIALCVSCQKESAPAAPQDAPQAITSTSLLVKLINDVSAFDGSFDNIVDGASCIAIKFPYSVIVNGEALEISTKEELSEIELRFDAYELDEDSVEIQFPVTLITSNYTQIIVQDSSALSNIADQCIEGGADADIECIDFIYPISVFTFDVNNEQLGKVVLERDVELRLFFSNLDENDRISFDFPISMEMYNGEQILVNSNSELAQAINGAKNSCDEDDDDDYNDDDFSQERLNTLLVECSWLIKELEREAVNVSQDFYLTNLNFTANGVVEYTDETGGTEQGSWYTGVENNTIYLNIEFAAQEQLNNTWRVYELEEGKIKLEFEGDKVVLQSTCDDYSSEAEILKATLQECSWIIKKVKKENELLQFLGYELQFLSDYSLLMEGNAVVLNGSWEVSTTAEEELLLNIEMPNGGPSISYIWPLEDIRYERLNFKNQTEDHIMWLEKNCYNDIFDEEVVDLRQAISEGGWQITTFVHNSDPNFVSYPETFQFAAEGLFKLDNALIDGHWRIYRNSEQQIELILTFGPESNYKYLGNDWEVVESSNNYLELVHEDDPNDYDQLIFERN